MQTQKIHKDKLVHPEKNVRTHGKKQLDEMRKSVRMFGQIRPVVTDENLVILAGNGLVMAVREMDDVQELDVLVMKNLTENDKVKLMIADNKIYTLGFDDNDVIMELLATLDGDFEVPGYDEELLSELLADADDVDEQIGSFGIMDQEEIEAINRRDELNQRRIEREQEVKENETEEEEFERVTRLNNKTASSEELEAYRQEQQELNSRETVGVDKVVTCPNCSHQFNV